MMFWVATTDTRWFEFLAPRHLDEVNFWQPSVRPAFENAPSGMPFVFKIRRPHNHIAGAGYFIARSMLPLNLAWEIFGQQNGAASLAELRELLGPLADRGTPLKQITCQVIANPVFFNEQDWLPNPPGWSSNIVRGKMYRTEEREGATIWAHVLPLLARGLETQAESSEGSPLAVSESVARYGEPTLMRPRLGQGSFRVVVTEAYHRKCAITAESTLLALEAAHIVPYAEEGAHDVRNGLLLRADFHRLFDAGLVSVTPDMTIRISPRIREAWFNGKAYYRMDGQPLAVTPRRPEFRPDPDRLQWHLRNRFQA
jgi:putative restriction endonuclease